MDFFIKGISTEISRKTRDTGVNCFGQWLIPPDTQGGLPQIVSDGIMDILRS